MPNYGLLSSLFEGINNTRDGVFQGLMEADRRKLAAEDKKKDRELEAAAKGLILTDSGEYVKSPETLKTEERKRQEHELGLLGNALRSMGDAGEGTYAAESLRNKQAQLLSDLGYLPKTAPTVEQPTVAPKGLLPQGVSPMAKIPGFLSKEDRAIDKATRQAVSIEKAKADLENQPNIRFNKTSVEGRNKLGLLAEAYRNMNQYADEYERGGRRRVVNPDTPVVGNFISAQPIDVASKNFTEAIGRLNSGGVINNQEVANFLKMIPTAFDDDKAARQKLADLQVALENRMQAFGFNLEQMEGLGFKGLKRAPQLKIGTTTDGFTYMGGDPADKKNWKKAK